MRFTKTNLRRVMAALLAHRFLINNEIVTCPDPGEYKDELQAMILERHQTDQLIRKVERAVLNEVHAAKRVQP